MPILLITPDLPKDSKFFRQWYLEYINVTIVWSKYTGKGIKIAVTDSGFLPRHSDIENNVISQNFSTYNTNHPHYNLRLDQHALQVASIIVAE